MNKAYFRDYHLHGDEQPDVGATARLVEQAELPGGEHPQEVAAADDDNACGAGVGRSLYDKGPISGELPCWYSSLGSPSQRSLFGDRDFDWRTAMRGPCVND